MSARKLRSCHLGAVNPCGQNELGEQGPVTAQQPPSWLWPGLYTVVSRWRSTEMVWQVECSSTRAVDSVASFTTPM